MKQVLIKTHLHQCKGSSSKALYTTMLYLKEIKTNLLKDTVC